MNFQQTPWSCRLHRASQTYSTVFLLCEEILPAPIIYGTLVPLVSWMALQKLIIQPYLRQQKQTELIKQRESNRTRYASLRSYFSHFLTDQGSLKLILLAMYLLPLCGWRTTWLFIFLLMYLPVGM